MTAVDDQDRARRPGGRTARTRAAVQEACLRLLAEYGVRGFSMEELADAAGVHKTTLYRRWPSMSALLGDVASELIMRDVAVPDTGTLEGDLRTFGQAITLVLNHPVNGPAMTALFTAPSSMTELGEVISTFWTHRLQVLRPIISRAVDRGELPAGTDGALLFECLGAPLYYRLLITRQPVDQSTVDRSVRITVAAGRNGSLCRD